MNCICGITYDGKPSPVIHRTPTSTSPAFFTINRSQIDFYARTMNSKYNLNALIYIGPQPKSDLILSTKTLHTREAGATGLLLHARILPTSSLRKLSFAFA